MPRERLIICGGATIPSEADPAAAILALHLYGSDDDQKITLRINDIRDQMYCEVPSRFRDLLDIAAYVFVADQAIERGEKDVETFGSNWCRDLHFVVPVSDLDFWRSPEVNNCLRETLGFLSDDYYRFEFVPVVERPSFQSLLLRDENGEALGFPEQVVMFSGGLDSLGGAVEEIVNQRRRLILVNHRATQKLDNRYEDIKHRLDKKSPDNRSTHIRVTVHKKKWMNKGYTQRTRSFLFAALGTTIANMLGQRSVRFYENGVISMNLPICAQVVGGKASRTTHPQALHGIQSLVSMVADARFTVENPFLWKTKTEIVDLIMKSGCSDLIGPSISCTHTWEMTKEHSHCGVCSQCVDRRFAIAAAGAEQHDPIEHYKIDVFTQSRSGNEKVHEDKTMFASYLERANEVGRIADALQFLVKYSEIARVIPYLDGEPGANTQRCFELYKRHSAEVNSVVDKMFARHAHSIRERTLPVDSLLRIVFESGLPTSAPIVPADPVPLPENVFRRAGGAWQVRFNGQKEITVLPWEGASYIHQLLSANGDPRSVIDIVCGTAVDICDRAISHQQAIAEGLQSVANPMLEGFEKISDWQAIAEFRARGRELLEVAERARRDNNELLVQECEEELTKIAATIKEVVGIGGKLKPAYNRRKSICDRFRKNVNRVIDRQIANPDPRLADHLREAITFGSNPRYNAVESIVWVTEAIQNT